MRPTRIDPDSPYSLPQQVLHILERDILKGSYAVGSRLPPEREMMKTFGVSRKTIRAALDELESRGLLDRHVGRGTFVKALPSARVETPRPKHVGIVYLKYTQPAQDPLTLDVLGGIHEAFQEEGIVTTTFSLKTDHDDHFEDLARRVENTPMDALLVMPEVQDRALERFGHLLPLLQAGYAIDPAGDFVGGDYQGLIRDAVRHLYGLGHQHIVYLTNCRENEQDARTVPSLKCAAFEDAMAKTGGKKFTGQIIFDAEFEAFFALDPLPTAVITAETRQAKEVLKRCRAWGVAIPQQLSLISFDDGSIGTHTDPPFDGMKNLTYALGRKAAQMLGDFLAGRRARPIQVLVKGELIRRATTARAPKFALTGGRIQR